MRKKKLTMEEKLDRLIDEFTEEKKLNAEHRESVKPLLDLIEGGIVARKVILWITSTIIGVIGAWVAIKGILMK